MYTRHRTIIRPRGDLRVPNHHTHGDVGVDVAGMGHWLVVMDDGLAKFFFCRARKGQKQHHTSLPHVKVGACTPTRTTCSMRVASWWNYIYCTFDVILLHLDKTILTETCETIQSNIHNNQQEQEQ